MSKLLFVVLVAFCAARAQSFSLKVAKRSENGKVEIFQRSVEMNDVKNAEGIAESAIENAEKAVEAKVEGLAEKMGISLKLNKVAKRSENAFSAGGIHIFQRSVEMNDVKNAEGIAESAIENAEKAVEAKVEGLAEKIGISLKLKKVAKRSENEGIKIFQRSVEMNDVKNAEGIAESAIENAEKAVEAKVEGLAEKMGISL